MFREHEYECYGPDCHVTERDFFCPEGWIQLLNVEEYVAQSETHKVGHHRGFHSWECVIAYAKEKVAA